MSVSAFTMESSSNLFIVVTADIRCLMVMRTDRRVQVPHMKQTILSMAHHLQTVIRTDHCLQVPRGTDGDEDRLLSPVSFHLFAF